MMLLIDIGNSRIKWHIQSEQQPFTLHTTPFAIDHHDPLWPDQLSHAWSALTCPRVCFISNVAANASGGARYGYALVWVLALASLMAMVIQYQSAKLGLVTGRTLPEAVRDHTRTPSRIGYWIQAELVAIRGEGGWS